MILVFNEACSFPSKINARAEPTLSSAMSRAYSNLLVMFFLMIFDLGSVQKIRNPTRNQTKPPVWPIFHVAALLGAEELSLVERLPVSRQTVEGLELSCANKVPSLIKCLAHLSSIFWVPEGDPQTFPTV